MNPMRDMSSLDASILALIADSVHGQARRPRDTAVLRRLRLLARRLEDPELRQVAEALISGTNGDNDESEDVLNTLRLLRKWAERNRRVHSPGLQEKPAL